MVLTEDSDETTLSHFTPSIAAGVLTSTMKDVIYILNDLTTETSKEPITVPSPHANDDDRTNSMRPTEETAPSCPGAPSSSSPKVVVVVTESSTLSSSSMAAPSLEVSDGTSCRSRTRMDPSPSGDAALVTQFLSLGCETVLDMTERVCHVSPMTTRTNMESVCGGGPDANEDTVQLLQASTQEKLVQSIQQQHSDERFTTSSSKVAETTEDQHQLHHKAQPRPETKPTTGQPPPPLSQDLSQEFSSEVSDFRDCAHQIFQNSDPSYYSASFRDFEAALNECICNHFLDDGDDQDSLASFSTSRSGYDGDTPHSRQRLLLQNSLLSRRAYARSLGSIAKQKAQNECQRHSSVELILAEDPMAPLVVLSDEDNSTSVEISMTDMSTTALECPPQNPPTETVPSAEKDPHVMESDNSLKTSPEEKKPESQEGKTEPEIVSEPEIVAMPEWNEQRASPDEYRIDPKDNSVVSHSSFDERPIRKRRFRKKHLQNESLDDDAEESILQSAELQLGQREEELARAAQVDLDSDKPSTFTMDKTEALKQLTSAAPKLYQAVVDRLGSMYERSGTDDTAAPQDGVNVKQDQGSNELSSTPPRKFKTQTARICSTPDKPYWADDSRDYVLEDFAVRDKILKKDPMRDNCHRLARIAPRHLKAKTVLPSRPPLTTTAQEPPHAHEPNRPTKPSKVRDVSNVRALASRCSSPTFDDAIKTETSSVHAEVDSDMHPSEELTPISDFHAGVVTLAELLKIKQKHDTRILDAATEDFLTSKSNRVSVLVENPRETMTPKKKVLDELETAPAAASLWQGRETYAIESERLQKGRALIRKIQRRREAALLARQVEQELHQRSASQLSNDDYVGRSTSTSLSSQETVEVVAPCMSEPRQDVEINDVDLGEEMRLHEFLMVRASSSSSSSVGRITRNAAGAYHGQAKQKSLLQLLARSTNGANDSMALQLSMDTALASEDTLVTGLHTRNFKTIVPPQKHPSIISIKKKNRMNDMHYQALQNVNDSLEIAQQLHSGDINDALAPPFPKSHMREYQLDEPPVFVSNDIASLHEVAACDLSGDDGKVLVFDSDTDHSCNHADDAAYHSAQKKYLNTRNDDGVFVNIRKKRSPTSITDFFSDPVPLQEKSVALNGEGGIPFLLRQEENDFLPLGMDWTNSRHDRFYEEQGNFVLPSSRSPPGKYMTSTPARKK